jgi:hypothetical protein
MANTVSPIYEMTIPEVTQDNNLWGGHLNADLSGAIPSSTTGLDGIISIPRVLRVAPTVGGSTNVVVSNGTYQKFTVNQVTTVNLSGWAVDTTPGKWGQRVVLVITGGGDFTVSWDAAITWLAGSPPVMQKSTGVDVIELFTVNNGTTVFGAHHSIADLLPINSPAVSGTVTLDLTKGLEFKYTNSQIHTVVISNPSINARRFRLFITNGSAFAITWPGSITWVSGTPPTLQSAGTDILEFFSPDVGTTWYGVRVGVVEVVNSNRCKANRATTQAIPQNTDTAIILNAADDYDTANLHDPSVNPSRVTVPTGGWPNSEAEIVGQITWEQDQFTADLQPVFIKKNGATELGRVTTLMGNDGVVSHTFQVIAFDNAPVATDYYELYVRTNRSGGNNITSAWLRVART